MTHGRSHGQTPYGNLPSHSGRDERYMFTASREAQEQPTYHSQHSIPPFQQQQESFGYNAPHVRNSSTHVNYDSSPYGTSVQSQTRPDHRVQAHSNGSVGVPWPSYTASTPSRSYLSDSILSTQSFSAGQLSHPSQPSARGSLVRSPAPSDGGYSLSGSSSSSDYQPKYQSDPSNRGQFYPTSPLAAPSPTFSDGDYAQSSSSSDGHDPLLSSSPAEYTTTFISSPYDTVSWPPGEATLATRSVQEAARRRRKRPARFRCELCPTDFTAKHNLENHMNSHRNIRPHKCKLGCGKSFGTAQVLRRHEPKCKGASSL